MSRMIPVDLELKKKFTDPDYLSITDNGGVDLEKRGLCLGWVCTRG